MHTTTHLALSCTIQMHDLHHDTVALSHTHSGWRARHKHSGPGTSCSIGATLQAPPLFRSCCANAAPPRLPIGSPWALLERGQLGLSPSPAAKRSHLQPMHAGGQQRQVEEKPCVRVERLDLPGAGRRAEGRWHGELPLGRAWVVFLRERERSIPAPLLCGDH